MGKVKGFYEGRRYKLSNVLAGRSTLLTLWALGGGNATKFFKNCKNCGKVCTNSNCVRRSHEVVLLAPSTYVLRYNNKRNQTKHKYKMSKLEQKQMAWRQSVEMTWGFRSAVLLGPP